MWIVVCVWLSRCWDGNPWKFCGVISTLFSYSFTIPSLHAVLLSMIILKLVPVYFWEGEDHCLY